MYIKDSVQFIRYLYFCVIMVLSRRLKYIVRIFVWSLIILHVGLFVLLNIPAVQGKMASLVSSELRKLLNTEVSVGHIELGMLNRIHVEDVYLNDLQGEELLKLNRLSARFELKPLLEGKIVVNSVQLIGFDIHLKQDFIGAVPNFQFVLDAFASKDTLKESPKIDLRINSVLLNRGKVTYDVLSAPETPGKFNPSHIGVEDFTASLSLKAFRNDTLNAAVRRLSFKEQSGFQLDKLALKVLADNKVLNVSDFKIELPTSTLRMDSLVVHYDSLQNIPKLTDDVTYKGGMKGAFVLKDLAPIVPVFAKMDRPLELSMSFQGKGKDIDLPIFSLSDEKFLNILGQVSLLNWDAKGNAFLQTKINDLSVTTSGISYLMNNLTGSVPSILKRLEFVNYKGSADGYLNDLHVDGSVRTAAGSLKADLLIETEEDMTRNYTGGVVSRDLHLGKLLGDDKFGKSDFDIKLEGFNYKDKYPQSYIKGVVSSLDYSGYHYENITLDGEFKNGGFNGNLALDDENGVINIDGSFNTSQRISDFNLRASIKKLRPNELQLTDKYVDSDLSLNLSANFTGSSIDDMNGFIRLDSLVMNAPENQGYSLDSLTLKAGNVSGKKEIHIQSSFMTGLIQGNYSYQTIPASVLQIVQQYIPSLVSINTNKKKLDNDFSFDIRLRDTKMLEKLFFIPIEIHMPASLQGYVDDRNGLMQIEGSFPKLIYNGTLYESATLLCKNPEGQFDCLLRGSMMMKSGAMLNFSLNAEAMQDKLKTILNWGNNTDVTYGGQVAAVTSFFKTEGKNPLLQADIDILPTKVVLNDTIWDIRSSHVAIDSGRVYVDNFLFERPGQHLRVDGKITRNPNDSCIVDLRNIDVQYVLDIVQFDDVEFGGLATGKVYLKNILNEPDMRTRLNVRRFAVNKGLMGDADILGWWDNDLPGIRLSAQMEEKDLSSTRVTGFVSPKLKGLDLHIEADSTNLDLLEPYFEGIFSELEARANGYVRLHGGFKTLDFEGGVSVNLDAKVDVLNTYFQLRNDSVYLSAGEFSLDNAQIFDREGHTGRVTGALRHTHLKDLNYHFDIEGENLLMYDTNDPGDMLFYGKVYGSGDITLSGGNNAMNIKANIRTGQNTEFTYVTGLTAEATGNSFINFVDKTPRRMQDSIQTVLYHYADAANNSQTDDVPLDLNINMFVDVTPTANMRVVMDPVAGDDISARGTGSFQVTYYNKGDFRIFGNYSIESGLYKLSMQEVIRKDFMLQSGSSVNFTGDPYLANLDVQAYHTVNSVSLSDLSTDASLNQSTVKVNCLMNLSGSLASPTIKFDLDIPNISDEDRELVRSATSTEEQMNTQIIYLLGIGKFYTFDYNDRANQSSNASSSLAYSTLSGQLNNMLSQVMESNNWDVGANFSSGQEGWSDVEAEAILSGRLLNNRLLVNGNFGYRENVMANTNFVGDFEAIWLLSKNGEFRLRGYNQTNDRYFTKSTLTTQGIGFIYKKDFNTWHDLFLWLMRKQNDKKK